MRLHAPLLAAILWAGCGNSSSTSSPPTIAPESLSFAQAEEMATSSDPRQRSAGVEALELQGAAARARLVEIAGDETAASGARCTALRAAAALGRAPEPTRPLALAMLPDEALNACAKIALRQLDGHAAISFERVAVMGASMSAGFGGAPVGNLLDELITVDHDVTSVADTFFYVSPFEKGREQIDRVGAMKPTVVVALDTLFWFVYVSADADRRMARLEQGLGLLERISAPLLLGDIPHMRDANPTMLAPEAIPPPDQLARFNQRIRDWAKNRIDVVVVPLSDWVGPLLRGQDVVIAPGRKPEPSAALMTFDKLHPNEEGVRYILRKLDAALEEQFPATAADALVVP